MTDDQIMSIWREMRPTQGDPAPIDFARRIEAIARHELADRLEVIADYSRDDGRREWRHISAWLHPGDMIAVLRASA